MIMIKINYYGMNIIDFNLIISHLKKNQIRVNK